VYANHMIMVPVLGCMLVLASLLAPFSVSAEPVRIQTTSYPPFMEQTEAGIGGLHTELVREAFKRADVPYTIEMTNLKRGLLLLQKSEIDAIYSPFKTPERAKSLYYMETPLFHVDVVLVGTYRTAPIYEAAASLEVLEGKRIGIRSGYFMGKALESAFQEGWITRVEVNSDEQMVKMLDSGRIDYFVHERSNAQLAIALAGPRFRHLTVLEPRINRQEAYIVFSQSDKIRPVADQIEKALQSMWDDQTIDRMTESFIQNRFKNTSFGPT